MSLSSKERKLFKQNGYPRLFQLLMCKDRRTILIWTLDLNFILRYLMPLYLSVLQVGSTETYSMDYSWLVDQNASKTTKVENIPQHFVQVKSLSLRMLVNLGRLRRQLGLSSYQCSELEKTCKLNMKMQTSLKGCVNLIFFMWLITYAKSANAFLRTIWNCLKKETKIESRCKMYLKLQKERLRRSKIQMIKMMIKVKMRL